MSVSSISWCDNPRRNKLYCTYVKKIQWKMIHPKRGQKLTLSNCCGSSEENIHFKYMTSLDLLDANIDDISHK